MSHSLEAVLLLLRDLSVNELTIVQQRIQLQKSQSNSRPKRQYNCKPTGSLIPEKHKPTKEELDKDLDEMVEALAKYRYFHYTTETNPENILIEDVLKWYKSQ